MGVWHTGYRLENLEPADQDVVEFDWTNWLNGATIADHSVTGTNITIDSSSLADGNTSVLAFFSSPVAGSDAKIVCQVTSDDATPRIKEIAINAYVQDL